MSDPMSDLEIEDVLSSIRRLVSEDNRRRPAHGQEGQRELPSGKSAERPTPFSIDSDKAGTNAGKLVLTESLRVVENTDTSDDTGMRANISGDGEYEEAAALPSLELPNENEDAIGDTMAAPDPQGRSGTLESTIAELEAAVDGSADDFEPDGSEMRPRAPDDMDADLDEAFDDGFEVEFASVEASELAEPVTSGPYSAPVKDSDEIVDENDTPLTQDAGDLDEDQDQVDDDDDRVIDGDFDDAESSEEAETAQEDSTFETDHSVSVEADLPAIAPAAAAVRGGTRRLNLTASERADDGETLRAADAEGPDAVDYTLPPEAATVPPEGEEDASILDPDMEAADHEMAMLRDLVAEIIREELRGPLGERITRNVRQLVRREITRILESGDFS